MIHSVHWGDVPTWLAALFGGAAALAALVQLSRQRGELRKVSSTLDKLYAEQLDLELEPGRQAARRARRQQADRISLYRDQVNIVLETTGGAATFAYLSVANVSDEPVRRVDVRFNGRPAERVGQLDHTKSEPQALTGQRTAPIEVLHPGESLFFLAPEAERDADNRAIVVRFDDADERRWEKTPNQRLDEAPDSDW